MSVRLLRYVSRLLVVLCLALAGADALCALPCGAPGTTSESESGQDSRHCQALSAGSADETLINSIGGPCGIAHGQLAPATERITSRWSSASTTAVSVARTPQRSQAALTIAIALLNNRSDGSPRAVPPLRI